MLKILNNNVKTDTISYSLQRRGAKSSLKQFYWRLYCTLMSCFTIVLNDRRHVYILNSDISKGLENWSDERWTFQNNIFGNWSYSKVMWITSFSITQNPVSRTPSQGGADGRWNYRSMLINFGKCLFLIIIIPPFLNYASLQREGQMLIPKGQTC